MTVWPKGRAQPTVPAENGGQKPSQAHVQDSRTECLNPWSLPLDCLASNPYCATLDKLLDLSVSLSYKLGKVSVSYLIALLRVSDLKD